ncbi:MAG: hypothetical protein WD398_07985 [Cyclobacteriaceae bacterium]
MLARCLSIFVIVVMIFPSCTNLKEVNEFSAVANNSLGQFENLEYSFNTSCHENCHFWQIKKFEITRNPECPCEPYLMADSITRQLYESLYVYWDGLERLTDHQLTRYDLGSAAETLNSGAFGKVELSSEEVSAFQKLGEIFLNAGTGNFRKKKVSLYIQQANPEIQVISEKLVFILSDNLEDLVAILQENWYGYFSDLSFSTNTSDYEKGLMVQAYYKKLREREKIQLRLQTMAFIILKLAEGHQKLAESDLKYSKSDLKNWLSSYSLDLQRLNVAFNQLKP